MTSCSPLGATYLGQGYISGRYSISQESYSDRDLYIKGTVQITSDRSLWIQGYITLSSDRSLYIRGGSSSSSNRSLYIKGIESSDRSLYIYGFSQGWYEKDETDWYGDTLVPPNC